MVIGLPLTSERHLHYKIIKLGNLTHPASIADAVKQADIIVLAIWFDGIKEFFKTYATELAGKIIVDPSNPIAPDEFGILFLKFR